MTKRAHEFTSRNVLMYREKAKNIHVIGGWVEGRSAMKAPSFEGML
jgi:hypothetical protein